MSSLNDISNERELRLVHNTEYGLISITHFDPYQNPEFSINISTEDFVTMLRWYMYQKEKDENYDAIQWSEEDQEIVDRFIEEMNGKTVDGVISRAYQKYDELTKLASAAGLADKILESDKKQALFNIAKSLVDDGFEI